MQKSKSSHKYKSAFVYLALLLGLGVFLAFFSMGRFGGFRDVENAALCQDSLAVSEALTWDEMIPVAQDSGGSVNGILYGITPEMTNAQYIGGSTYQIAENQSFISSFRVISFEQLENNASLNIKFLLFLDEIQVAPNYDLLVKFGEVSSFDFSISNLSAGLHSLLIVGIVDGSKELPSSIPQILSTRLMLAVGASRDEVYWSDEFIPATRGNNSPYPMIINGQPIAPPESVENQVLVNSRDINLDMLVNYYPPENNKERISSIIVLLDFQQFRLSDNRLNLYTLIPAENGPHRFQFDMTLPDSQDHYITVIQFSSPQAIMCQAYPPDVTNADIEVNIHHILVTQSNGTQ